MGRPRRGTFALVAAGGTGGHVMPALAVAEALVARGHPADTIHFVGSQRGMEGRLVPEAGFSVTLLPGRGVPRKVSWAAVKALAGLAVAVVRATVLVGRLRPAVAVSAGGYASLPAVLGAAVWRVPVVVIQHDAVPGLANQVSSRFAVAVAVAFPRVRMRHAVVTGNPLRAMMAHVDRTPIARQEARQALGLPPGSRVVAVTGGSLGAGRLNQAAQGLAERWAERSGLAVYHVAGERNAGAFPPLRSSGDGLAYVRVGFEARMDLVYSAADVVVSRAGATTVSELAAAGVASILIPLPGAPADHQSANAADLVESGAALLVADAEATPERLASLLDELLDDPARLERMSAAASSQGRPGAADAVVDLLEANARPGPG